jgi:hypothetical protein
MDDVMATAFNYPYEPLPRPYNVKDQPYLDTIASRLLILPDGWIIPTNRDVILEPPMYFPGYAWKGTAGMPHCEAYA